MENLKINTASVHLSSVDKINLTMTLGFKFQLLPMTDRF